MSDGGKKSKRSSNWTCVLYPESCNERWQAILDSFALEWVLSPLHDKDVNEADNELKKAHYHLMVMFGSLKSYEQAVEITESLGATVPQRVNNTRALVRYMLHMDNPEKAQYDVADLRHGGGVDLQELLRANKSEKYAIIAEMQDFCREFEIIEFQDLMDYARTDRFDTWFPLLCDSCTMIMVNYIKSQRHRAKGN